jgi:hypothetical protein
VLTQMWPQRLISTSHARKPCLSRITQNSCFEFESGVLKILFILSKHSTKANIRSTMMANNRYAYNRDVISSYWTSDGLPLCCSQPTGEKTHKPTMWKTSQEFSKNLKMIKLSKFSKMSVFRKFQNFNIWTSASLRSI